MSSSNNNNDEEGDSEMGVAYTTGEEYPSGNNLRTLSTINPVEYLEYVATQEQYAPKNLSLHQDSLPSQEQFINERQASTSSREHYDNPQDPQQQNLIDNYNPYFPPTEQQFQQVQQFHNNKPLSPLDEVVHNNANSDSYQIEIINDDTNQQSQFQQQYQQQSPTQYIDDSDDSSSPVDHSAVTPSPLSLSGLYLSRNRSRISTPKIENLPRIPSAYTAQVQQSDSPLRTEFRDVDNSDSDTSSVNNVKNILGEILNKDRITNLTNLKARKMVKPSNESLVKFDFHNARGDPDDPLLNNINTQPSEEEERQLPTGLLSGNINNNDNNNQVPSNINIIPHRSSKYSQPVSPVSTISPASQVTPIIPMVLIEKVDENLDVIKLGPDKEIRIHKPNQGTIFMLLAIFVLASFIFIIWMLSDLGIGNARDIYNFSTSKGVLSIYPPGTKKAPPIFT